MRLVHPAFVILYLAMLSLSVAAKERAEAPTILKLYLGGSIYGPTYSVELWNGVLHYTERDGGKETEAVVSPTPEQWRAFRKILDANNIWSWRRTKSRRMHSRQWTVTITYRSSKIDLTGDGKFPGQTPNVYGSTVAG